MWTTYVVAAQNSKRIHDRHEYSSFRKIGFGEDTTRAASDVERNVKERVERVDLSFQQRKPGVNPAPHTPSPFAI
jgi:hypothetical protein